MGDLRRLDHVGIVVHDTAQALTYFSGRLGLPVVASEEIHSPHVRLTYLDTGNALLQLVEPLNTDSHVARALEKNGEGFHHLCFAVEDVVGTAEHLADDGAGSPPRGSGLGRVSAFVPGKPAFGIQIECTEFREKDLDLSPGWLK